MTKADLVEGIHAKVGLSKKESADIVEMVFDTMKETLEKCEKIKISGFGNFEALVLQHHPHGLADGLFVVHN